MTRGCGGRKLQDNFVKAARQFCDKRLLRGKFVTIGYRARNCGDNFATGLGTGNSGDNFVTRGCGARDDDVLFLVTAR